MTHDGMCVSLLHFSKYFISDPHVKAFKDRVVIMIGRSNVEG